MRRSLMLVAFVLVACTSTVASPVTITVEIKPSATTLENGVLRYHPKKWCQEWAG